MCFGGMRLSKMQDTINLVKLVVFLGEKAN